MENRVAYKKKCVCCKPYVGQKPTLWVISVILTTFLLKSLLVRLWMSWNIRYRVYTSNLRTGFSFKYCSFFIPNFTLKTKIKSAINVCAFSLKIIENRLFVCLIASQIHEFVIFYDHYLDIYCKVSLNQHTISCLMISNVAKCLNFSIITLTIRSAISVKMNSRKILAKHKQPHAPMQWFIETYYILIFSVN